MQTHGPAILVVLAALALTACDRSKPGNPMPPQKPPMPKTDADTPLKNPGPNGPVNTLVTRRA